MFSAEATNVVKVTKVKRQKSGAAFHQNKVNFCVYFLTNFKKFKAFFAPLINIFFCYRWTGTNVVF
jgi:hypothetical protein